MERIKANLESAMDVICIVEDVIAYSVETVIVEKTPVFVIEIHLQQTEGTAIYLDPIALMDMSRQDVAKYLLNAFGWQKVEKYPS